MVRSVPAPRTALWPLPGRQDVLDLGRIVDNRRQQSSVIASRIHRRMTASIDPTRIFRSSERALSRCPVYTSERTCQGLARMVYSAHATTPVPDRGCGPSRGTGARGAAHPRRAVGLGPKGGAGAGPESDESRARGRVKAGQSGAVDARAAGAASGKGAMRTRIRAGRP